MSQDVKNYFTLIRHYTKIKKHLILEKFQAIKIHRQETFISISKTIILFTSRNITSKKNLYKDINYKNEFIFV